MRSLQSGLTKSDSQYSQVLVVSVVLVVSNGALQHLAMIRAVLALSSPLSHYVTSSMTPVQSSQHRGVSPHSQDQR